MQGTQKEKMCASCEGRIPFDAEVCPYCATDQAGSSFKAPLFQNQSLQDSLTSLYTPPYQGKKPQFGQATQELPQMEEEEMEPVDPYTPPSYDDEAEADKSPLWPTLLLIGGSNFALLGLMQLFFSKNGVLRLEWNAHLWFLYILLGAPLLYFGHKKAKEL